MVKNLFCDFLTRWWTAASVGEVVDEMHTSLIDERLHTGSKNGYLSATIGACSALCAFLTGRSKNFVKKNSVSIVLGCMYKYLTVFESDSL